jgi:ABC-type proline/glycine betaine transport system ATPase subunit
MDEPFGAVDPIVRGNLQVDALGARISRKMAMAAIIKALSASAEKNCAAMMM